MGLLGKLKRKNQKNDFDGSDNFEDWEENEITAGHDFQVGELDESESNELDEKTKKQIDDSEMVENAEDMDDMPSANSSGRDTGNKKKLQLAGIALVGLLLVMIGLGATMNRMQDAREQKRVEEAEQAAQDQKKMADGTVDISADQADIENQQLMYDLPPPASVEPLETTAEIPPPVEPMPPVTMPTYVEPVTPTPTVTYNEPLVAGRDYTPPPPIPSSQPSSSPAFFSSSEPEPVVDVISESEPIEPPMPKGADSSVMVDVQVVKTSTSAYTLTDNNQKGNKDSKVGGNLTPTVLAAASANRRESVSLMLLKGTTIPCILKTKIDSTYQGFTICQISRDVYSSDGRTLLLERGSQVFGEQNIDITQGQARVSVLWSRVETPQGVSVDVNSPAVGKLGEMGIGADIDNHYAQRFGAAILLSVIQDAIATGMSRWEDKEESNGDNNTTINNTENTANEMAEEVLKHSIDIPPTATVNQGTLINILVARDVDFSGVYKLEER